MARTWPSLIGASILIWVMCGIVLSGVKRTAALNVLASFLNIFTIGFALILMAFYMTGPENLPSIYGASKTIWAVFSRR